MISLFFSQKRLCCPLQVCIVKSIKNYRTEEISCRKCLCQPEGEFINVNVFHSVLKIEL